MGFIRTYSQIDGKARRALLELIRLECVPVELIEYQSDQYDNLGRQAIDGAECVVRDVYFSRGKSNNDFVLARIRMCTPVRQPRPAGMPEHAESWRAIEAYVQNYRFRATYVPGSDPGSWILRERVAA